MNSERPFSLLSGKLMEHYLPHPASTRVWDGQVWRRPRCKRFLLPVKALSPVFRAKVRIPAKTIIHSG
jgi:hypothetical protein